MFCISPKVGLNRIILRMFWVLEYSTLILVLVLGSYYRYFYLKSIYFFAGSAPKQSVFPEGHPRLMFHKGKKLKREDEPNLFPLGAT